MNVNKVYLPLNAAEFEEKPGKIIGEKLISVVIINRIVRISCIENV